LAAFKLKDYAHAAACFGLVAQRLPLPSVEADLALAKAHAQAGAAPATGKLQTDLPVEDYRQLMGAVAQFDSRKAAKLPADQQINFDLQEGQRLAAQGGLDAAETQYQAALTLLTQAGATEPGMLAEIAAAHVGLARLWMARHDSDKASGEVKAALQADPGNLAAQALQRQLSKEGGRG
ncbi:MAG: tetratricopeptide repeat protein, partial [Terriglobales bacterium]